MLGSKFPQFCYSDTSIVLHFMWAKQKIKNIIKVTNMQVSQKEFETYLRIKKLIEERYKYEDFVQPTHSSQSKGMGLIAYQTLQVTLGFRDKSWLMLIST